MEKLKVRDPKGNERTMTRKSFDMAASKRGFKIIGTVIEEQPLSEVEKIKREMIAKREQEIAEAKAAQQDAQNLDAEKPEVKKGKPGPKPKKNED